MNTYHMIITNSDEWLTTSDGVAEMALSEGLEVHLDLEPATIDELRVFHDSWQDIRIIT